MITRRILLSCLSLTPLALFGRRASALSVEAPDAATADLIAAHRDAAAAHRAIWREAQARLVAEGHAPADVARVLGSMRCSVCGGAVQNPDAEDAQ